MKEKYFDPWEFEKNMEFINTNPLKAKQKFEEYIEQYPNDYYCYPFYASSLIALGHFNKASQIINYAEKNYVKNERIFSKSRKEKFLKESILFSKLKLFLYTGKYKEAHELYLKNKKTLDNLKLHYVFFYCRTQVDKENIKKEEIDSYSYRQMLTYTEEDFKNHIKKHTADYNRFFDEPNKLIFNPDFPLNDVIEEIKKYIPSSKKICNGFYENIYSFKYDECGRVNNSTVNYFKVIVFHNTAKFITMYPSNECENLPYIDLNYMIKDKKEPKIKIKSQIEKFNQRYRRK